MSSLLELKDIHVAYGQVDAVRGVSLHLNKGETISVIGPNGAGKTTLLSAVMGLLPYRGQVLFEGQDIARLSVEDRVERGMCLAPESRELFGKMSVLDNLQLGAYPKRLSGKALQQRLEVVYAKFPRLAERANQRADTLSGGERQMLTIGRALMSQPRLLMLDEPSLGLAPLIVVEILAIVRQLREEGVSVLLVEQNALAALQSSTHGYVLEAGEVALSGLSSELATDPRVHATYLGSSAGDED